MYVTNVNECIALDAGSGRQVWRFIRPQTPKLFNDAGCESRRGRGWRQGLSRNRQRAHRGASIVSPGEQVWDSAIADPAQNYFATSAPLTAGDLVVTGVAGGEHGANGQVVAFEQATGKEVGAST